MDYLFCTTKIWVIVDKDGGIERLLHNQIEMWKEMEQFNADAIGHHDAILLSDVVFVLLSDVVFER